jgi:hypothetical protein
LQQNVTASVDTCPLGVHNRLSVPDTPQTPRTRIIFQTVSKKALYTTSQ